MSRLNYEKKDLGQSYATAVITMVVSSLVLVLIFGEQTGGFKFWLMQALYTLLIGGSAFLYAVLTKTKVFVATKLNVAPRYAHVLWGCLAVTFLIACMMPLNTALLDGFEALGLRRPSVELENNLAGLLIVACVLPAFTEELVFRGTVAMSLAGARNKLGVLAVSGVLFAIFHANPAQTIHQFVLGAFLTLIVLRSGSLWTSVIVHFFNNALVVALNYTKIGEEQFWSFTDNTAVVVTCLCVGVVGFALSVFGYLKTTKSLWRSSDVHCDVRGDGAQVEDAMGNEKNTPGEQKNAIKKHPVSIITLIVAVAVCVTLWIANLLAV